MGRIIVHLHGKPKQASYSALIEMYADRLKGRNIKIKTHSDKVSSPDYQNKLMDNKLVFYLDETGQEYSSIELSKMVSNWGLNSEDVHLAIGPVDGWSDKRHLTSKNSIRLSKMTFPHELAGVLILEQLYRASEIIKGTMYHRE
ncbi:MAG: 23S rRNA (pseudouridine(1915)-N(3))-methyltransferase RlmH [Candidatus Poseidoniaceae archaeon]|nr:23S rRNA (pseudouridine(1915)-N(3))-methyltransferase RlmH [Candidatus Poseidoniaceae archaeon]